MSGEGKVVLVTAASGYIASWLVKLLLEDGYTVKATVSDRDDPNIKHLHDLDGAKERLDMLKANLLEEGFFDSAVDGCVGVFHTASPAELVDPAVKGTLNVLMSCVKVQIVERVVITSSIASVIFNGKRLNPEVVNWHPLSKTLAEEAASRFAEEIGFDLITLHLGVVIGPILQLTLNFSVDVIFNIIYGSQTFPSPYSLVDVRDVALVHIQALEVPTANGKYLLVGRVTHVAEILKILQENYPFFNLLEKFRGKAVNNGPTFQVSKERAKSLGINFMPWEVSLRDTVECLKDKGFFISKH